MVGEKPEDENEFDTYICVDMAFEWKETNEGHNWWLDVLTKCAKQSGKNKEDVQELRSLYEQER